MAKRLLFVILVLLSFIQPVSSGPRTWGKSGSATSTSTQLTCQDDNSVNFNPASICVKNTGATNDLIINWQNASPVASATDNKGNIIIKPGDTMCYTSGNPNVLNTFIVAVFSTSGTTYNIQAVAAR